MRIATFPCDYTMNRAFSLENRAQAADIVLGTCPTMVHSRSTATVYRSLLLPISLLRGNCSPMVGVQMFLKRDALECSCPQLVHTPCCLYLSCRARAHAQAPSVGACLGRAWSSMKLIFLFMLVSTNSPNLKSSGYMVVDKTGVDEMGVIQSIVHVHASDLKAV